MSTYSASKAVALSAVGGAAALARRDFAPTAPASSPVFAWVEARLCPACWWEDVGDWSRTRSRYRRRCDRRYHPAGTLARWLGRLRRGLAGATPWLLALGLFLALGVRDRQICLAAAAVLSAAAGHLRSLHRRLPKLLDSVSLRSSCNSAAMRRRRRRFLTGVAIGWSRSVGYWVHPVLRFIGPLPATAWLPIAFFAFPSSWSA